MIHDKFVDLAKRLTTKHGRMVDFYKMANIDNPSQPWKGTAKKVLIGSYKVAFVPFRGYEFGAIFERDELFEGCSEVGLFAGWNDELDHATHVEDEGFMFRIEALRRLRPGPQTVLYAIGIQR